MKSLFFCLLLFVTGFAQAQTTVVRLKSHHGAVAEIPRSLDRFGGPPVNFEIAPIEQLNPIVPRYQFNIAEYDTTYEEA